MLAIVNIVLDTAKSYHLTAILWDAISLLEADCGLKLLAICCDGSPHNRKMFSNFVKSGDDNFKFINPFDKNRNIYLWPDPPHLLKVNCYSLFKTAQLTLITMQTARNSMKNRELLTPYGVISWSHVEKAYQKVSTAHLHQPCKLTDKHVYLTSFSQMSVSLAAQVGTY